MLANIEDILQLNDPSDIQLFCENNFKTQPIHLYWKNNQGKYLGCNETNARNAGFNNSKDMIGQTDLELCWVTEACANNFTKTNESIMLSKKSKILFETALIRGTTPLHALSYKMPLYTQKRKVHGIAGFSILLNQHDISLNSTQQLTARQEDCLYYLIHGMTIKQIAHKLSLSSKTIEHYIENIKIKLNCNTRSDLISKALQISSIKMRLFFN